MSAAEIVDSVKGALSEARSKAQMVGAHSQDVLKVGSQTLRAAKEVVVQAGRDTANVLSHSRDELKRTLQEGGAQMRDRLSRLATPNRKEEALARKLEVKAKKRRKREEAQAEGEGAEPAAI